MEEHPDYNKVNGVRSIENGVNNENVLVHRMYGAVQIDGQIYRVKTTMYEHYSKDNVPHDYRVTKIELLISGSSTSDALSNSIDEGSNPKENIGLSYPIAKLLKGVDKAYEKGKNILKESKISDERINSYRDNDETADILTDRNGSDNEEEKPRKSIRQYAEEASEAYRKEAERPKPLMSAIRHSLRLGKRGVVIDPFVSGWDSIMNSKAFKLEESVFDSLKSVEEFQKYYTGKKDVPDYLKSENKVCDTSRINTNALMYRFYSVLSCPVFNWKLM